MTLRMVSRNSVSDLYDEEAFSAVAACIPPTAMKTCARYAREVDLKIILNEIEAGVLLRRNCCSLIMLFVN